MSRDTQSCFSYPQYSTNPNHSSNQLNSRFIPVAVNLITTPASNPAELVMAYFYVFKLFLLGRTSKHNRYFQGTIYSTRCTGLPIRSTLRFALGSKNPLITASRFFLWIAKCSNSISAKSYELFVVFPNPFWLAMQNRL